MNDPGHVHDFRPHYGSSPTRPERRLGSEKTLWICAECKREVASRRPDGPTIGVAPWGLHRREMEVFTYIADGRRVPYIAHRTGMNIRTVQNVVSRIRNKVGVRTEAQLREAYARWEAGALR